MSPGRRDPGSTACVPVPVRDSHGVHRARRRRRPPAPVAAHMPQRGYARRAAALAEDGERLRRRSPSTSLGVLTMDRTTAAGAGAEGRPRVVLASRRLVEQRVWHAAQLELEDVVAEVDDVAWCLPRPLPPGPAARLARGVLNRAGRPLGRDRRGLMRALSPTGPRPTRTSSSWSAPTPTASGSCRTSRRTPARRSAGWPGSWSCGARSCRRWPTTCASCAASTTSSCPTARSSMR